MEKLIKDAFEKLFVIRRDIGKIADEDIRKRLEAICDTGEKIISEVRTSRRPYHMSGSFSIIILMPMGKLLRNT